MKKPGRIRRAIRNNVGLLVLVIGFFGFRTAIADWSYVPTGSMEPTFYGGDWLLVNKTYYGPSIPFTDFRLLSLGEPERGDIVTFYPPHEDELYVKRVIGVPGDSVLVAGPDIYVNGAKLILDRIRVVDGLRIGEEVIGDVRHLVQFSEGRALPVLPDELIVPENEYFVLGDHRNNSADSRYFGFVDEESVVGKVTHVAFSFSRRRPLFSRVAIPVD